MNKVEQFCGQCAVATVAKDKRKKEGDHFNLIFLVIIELMSHMLIHRNSTVNLNM